jgi:hypothetical protein
VEVPQRDALDVAVHEDADATRVQARPVFDRDVGEAVLVFHTLGELAKPFALDVEVAEEALDVTVPHGDVRERRAGRGVDVDAVATVRRRDARVLAVESHVGGQSRCRRDRGAS